MLREGPSEDCEVWPEHQQVFEVWVPMSDQWLFSSAGPAALNLASLPPVLDILGVPQEDRKRILPELRLIAAGALDEIQQQQKKG